MFYSLFLSYRTAYYYQYYYSTLLCVCVCLSILVLRKRPENRYRCSSRYSCRYTKPIIYYTHTDPLLNVSQRSFLFTLPMCVFCF